MELLVQMRQTNKGGSVKNDEIINLLLGSSAGPLSQHPLSPTRHQPHLLIPFAQNSQPGKKQRAQKSDRTSNKLYGTALAYAHRIQGLERQTWNPLLREVVARSTWRNKEQTPKKKPVISYSLDSYMDPRTQRGRLGTQCTNQPRQTQPSSSHLNKGSENVRQKNTKAQEENKSCKMIPTPCSPTPTLI